MNALKGDMPTSETERPECFNFPPRVPEGIVSPEDARAQRDIGLLFEQAIHLAPNELYERAPLHRLHNWVTERDPGQLCHFIDKKIVELLEAPLETQALDELLLVVEELNIGQTFEKSQYVPATVTLQNQLYFLKDLAFYQRYPTLFALTEAQSASGTGIPAEKRYSSVEMYPIVAKAVADLGISIDADVPDFEHFQPIVKYFSSRAVDALFTRSFNERVRSIALAKGLATKGDSPIRPDFVYLREQALDQMDALLTLYSDDPDVLELRDHFIRNLAEQPATVRCRMFFDHAADLNDACDVLKASMPDSDNMGLKVVHHADQARVLYMPFEHRVSVDPSGDVATHFKSGGIFGGNNGVYASVHAVVPVDIGGADATMEIQLLPSYERPLISMMHTSLTQVCTESLDARGLASHLNTRMENAAKGVDLFLAQA